MFVYSGCGLPQLYAFVEAGCVQISVGQEHVTCLSLLAELSEQLTSPPRASKQAAEAGAERSEVTDHVALHQSFDDIRAGSFRYVTASGKQNCEKVTFFVFRQAKSQTQCTVSGNFG